MPFELVREIQRVALVRSQVWRQADVAEVIGINRQRVATLLLQAVVKVAELNERRGEQERPVASRFSSHRRQG